MHGTPLFSKSLIVWSNELSAFVFDYAHHRLHFCSVENEWEMEDVSIAMWHTEKNWIHNMLDEYMKVNKMFFSDNGHVIKFNHIKSAGCQLSAMSVPRQLPLPKKYRVAHYVVSTGDESTFTINRFLRNRGVLTKYNFVMEYHGTLDYCNGMLYPKDLFYPIKYGVNGYFSQNDHAISDFTVWDSMPF